MTKQVNLAPYFLRLLIIKTKLEGKYLVSTKLLPQTGYQYHIKENAKAR